MLERRTAPIPFDPLGHGPPSHLDLSGEWIQVYALMERLGLLHTLRPPSFVRFTTEPSSTERYELEKLATLSHWRARCRNALGTRGRGLFSPC